jgi:hypothetical protein
MDRFAAMIILLTGLVVSCTPTNIVKKRLYVGSHLTICSDGFLVIIDSSQTTVLVLLALFVVSPITCSCLVSLLYSLYLFIAYEESGLHYAQEFEVSSNEALRIRIVL